MARHYSHLFDAHAGLKEPARGFVPEIVEVEVVDADSGAGHTKTVRHILWRDRENGRPVFRLPLEDFPGIEPGAVYQWHPHMVSDGALWVLAVPDED
jgi:hypothetical protein